MQEPTFLTLSRRTSGCLILLSSSPSLLLVTVPWVPTPSARIYQRYAIPCVEQWAQILRSTVS